MLANTLDVIAGGIPDQGEPAEPAAASASA
jgi:hypothetical protein